MPCPVSLSTANKQPGTGQARSPWLSFSNDRAYGTCPGSTLQQAFAVRHEVVCCAGGFQVAAGGLDILRVDVALSDGS